jgi:hypothetical protein
LFHELVHEYKHFYKNIYIEKILSFLHDNILM